MLRYILYISLNPRKRPTSTRKSTGIRCNINAKKAATAKSKAHKSELVQTSHISASNSVTASTNDDIGELDKTRKIHNSPQEKPIRSLDKHSTQATARGTQPEKDQKDPASKKSDPNNDVGAASSAYVRELDQLDADNAGPHLQEVQETGKRLKIFFRNNK